MSENGKIETTLEYIKRDIAEIKKKLDSNYVTKVEFEPVKKIVYGLIAIILITVVGAIIGLVVIK